MHEIAGATTHKDDLENLSLYNGYGFYKPETTTRSTSHGDRLPLTPAIATGYPAQWDFPADDLDSDMIYHFAKGENRHALKEDSSWKATGVWLYSTA